MNVHFDFSSGLIVKSEYSWFHHLMFIAEAPVAIYVVLTFIFGNCLTAMPCRQAPHMTVPSDDFGRHDG